MPLVKSGDVLAGKYRVERVIGSGGMGYVVAARHLDLDQTVAIKLLRRDLAGADEHESVGRMIREAQAVVRLRNEHVAKVFDMGALESGEPYIVMEYLEGQDLSALAKRRGAIASHEAVDYVLQACEALAEAHALGIVHRDVKLANLFVTRTHAGYPLIKVLDFGVSKVIAAGLGDSMSDMTHTASMLGSPRFMSPEQMRDPRAVDARTDIWSLGVVLYRLIAGRPPFDSDVIGVLLSMVLHEQPEPLSVARPDIPRALSDVVARCLEKDVNRRYPSVAHLAADLVQFASDPSRAYAVAERVAQTFGNSAVISAEHATAPAPSHRVSALISSAPLSVPSARGTEVGSHQSHPAAPTDYLNHANSGVSDPSLLRRLVGSDFLNADARRRRRRVLAVSVGLSAVALAYTYVHSHVGAAGTGDSGAVASQAQASQFNVPDASSSHAVSSSPQVAAALPSVALDASVADSGPLNTQSPTARPSPLVASPSRKGSGATTGEKPNATSSPGPAVPKRPQRTRPRGTASPSTSDGQIPPTRD